MTVVPLTTTAVLPAGTFAGRDQPVLSSARLVLRPWDPADVEAVVGAYADPDIRRWHARTMTADEAEAWTAHWHVHARLSGA
ncbi:GNAT family N-acetyltransferase [Actinotalea ferrariae]|uniref:GNAT family N-acetyltransferase n=1 Tax=Actinotalea ferrariae TaxID=1386098 RepID=UPI001C8CBA1A|nr:GNAT family N-acetyltransferase [Actinotalea ferrariae]MBX9245682.1 GNAT family N-acetyltransferase [Actinotalea ferrariae]